MWPPQFVAVGSELLGPLLLRTTMEALQNHIAVTRRCTGTELLACLARFGLLPLAFLHVCRIFLCCIIGCVAAVFEASLLFAAGLLMLLLNQKVARSTPLCSSSSLLLYYPQR